MKKGIIAAYGGSEKREIVPAGTHIARCYSMIHIGTVEWEWQGEIKESNKVKIAFELPNEMRDFGGEEKPMVISKEYTISLHEKSNLRRDLETWRGKEFTTKELSSFDITNLLEKCCNISIVHKMSKGGKQFANIGGISALAKGVECPEQFNPTFVFNYEDNFNEEWLDGQPEWIQEQIKSTPEYKNKTNKTKENGIPF